MKKMWLAGVALGASLALAGTASAQDISVGVAGPMTGQYASFGTQLKNGAEAAVADINAAGGVMGKKLKLEVGDDACDPKQARAVGREVRQRRSCRSSPGTIARRRRSRRRRPMPDGGVLQITPASTNPTFTERNLWNTFRVCGRDDQQGTVAGDYIAKNYKGKNIAILQDKSTYGKGLADEMKKALNKAGVKEKMYEAYTQGDKDFNSLVSKMKANKIDVVYVGGYHTEAGLILRQMRGQGMQSQMISGDAIATNEFWSITGAGRRRHDVHLRLRSAQAADRRRGGEEVQGQGRRSGGLHALHLRRDADLGAGRHQGQDHRRQEGRRDHPAAASGTPCWARSATTRRATSPRWTTCSTSGARTASTTRSRPARARDRAQTERAKPAPASGAGLLFAEHSALSFDRSARS